MRVPRTLNTAQVTEDVLLHAVVNDSSTTWFPIHILLLFVAVCGLLPFHPAVSVLIHQIINQFLSVSHILYRALAAFLVCSRDHTTTRRRVCKYSRQALHWTVCRVIAKRSATTELYQPLTGSSSAGGCGDSRGEWKIHLLLCRVINYAKPQLSVIQICRPMWVQMNSAWSINQGALCRMPGRHYQLVLMINLGKRRETGRKVTCRFIISCECWFLKRLCDELFIVNVQQMNAMMGFKGIC